MNSVAVMTGCVSLPSLEALFSTSDTLTRPVRESEVHNNIFTLGSSLEVSFLFVCLFFCFKLSLLAFAVISPLCQRITTFAGTYLSIIMLDRLS